MRPLTSEEQALLARRQAEFDSFLAERMPVLSSFMNALELPNPTMVLIHAEEFAPALDAWLQRQTIQADDWSWILTRVGYFIGEYLVQEYGGYWFLNELPDSRYFGRYVVGRFRQATSVSAMVDPFEVAQACLSNPRDESLLKTLAELGAELSRNPSR